MEPPGAAGAPGLGATRPIDVRDVPPKRRRPYALLAVGGAFAAVVAAGVLAAGMLSSAADQPNRHHALPLAPTPAPADPTKPVPPSAKASTRPSATAPVKPRLAPPPASPTRSSAPSSSSPPPPTARATGSVRTTPPPRHEPTVRAALAEGDKGPEVAELQERLAQLHLYPGKPDGAYTRLVSDAVTRYQWARGLTDDPRGEYGRETRRSLEAETAL
ncbi:peptidoglycan-binding protein [Streptomyces sp. NPDC050703]|uniref:peptidoglycan-binding domain-containing protein n=1 Tax=Streptomyces sp. NPDC050703 TaxID=3157218 RepID=UPI00343FB8BC